LFTSVKIAAANFKARALGALQGNQVPQPKSQQPTPAPLKPIASGGTIEQDFLAVFSAFSQVVSDEVTDVPDMITAVSSLETFIRDLEPLL